VHVAVEQPILALLERLVESQQCRWLEDDGYPRNPTLAEKERPEAQQEPIERGQVRCASARSVDLQELLLQQDAFGDNGPPPARSEEFRDRAQEMSEEDEKVLHGREA